MDTYTYITNKIHMLRENYLSLSEQPDTYVFSLLCIKANFYKNPMLILQESDFADIIVDSRGDGGADILMNDPTSEESDIVIGQSKFYKSISKDDVLNAMLKMVRFYNDMQAGRYEEVNPRVQQRFLTLNAETSEESRVHFVFYTSAPKNRIDTERIEKQILEQFTNPDAVEVSIFFAADIVNEIKESESIKQLVERGKIIIDETNNYLMYGDDAAIVNASAFSIRQLYAEHGKTLLAHNLRYHINGGKIDREIRETIDKNPKSFWLKNNGITMICDEFRIDGREVHLKNFSIVNGGQTVYVLNKSNNLDATRDFWIACKIIKTTGATEKDKVSFSLEIAKAANSQKPIKEADLKANAPEQRSFSQFMRAVGVFYQTKRGESVPKQFAIAYLHTKLLDVGKLCLAAIFQEPCKSRTKPSSVYSQEYYEPIFNEKTQKQVAQISKELLYINDYFTKKFLTKFDKENEDMPDASIRSPFAHTARTICIAFTALAARYHQGNLTDKDVTMLTSDKPKSTSYDRLRNLGEIKSLLPIKLCTDAYDTALDKLFTAIIEEGITTYSFKCDENNSLTAANFLKKDENYYLILKRRWSALKKVISDTFSEQ